MPLCIARRRAGVREIKRFGRSRIGKTASKVAVHMQKAAKVCPHHVQSTLFLVALSIK